MIKLYNADCLDVLKTIPDKSIDLTLTDPPYGINLKYSDYDDTEDNWYSLIAKVLPEIMRVSKMVIMPSCQIKRLKWFYVNYPPDWIICWYKGSTGHNSYIGFNDWEPHLVYGKRKNQLYMHDYFQTKASPKKNTFNHPCPKPIEWADWIIERVMRDEKITVFDPFTGSGTVGLSALKNNCDFIGCEISEEYCDIAVKRIQDAGGNVIQQ